MDDIYAEYGLFGVFVFLPFLLFSVSFFRFCQFSQLLNPVQAGLNLTFRTITARFVINHRFVKN